MKTDYSGIHWQENGRLKLLDMFTDSHMLGESIYNGNEDILYKSMAVPYSDYRDIKLITRKLITSLSGERKTHNHETPRYWHGYVVIVKLLLAFITYRDIRILNLIMETVIFLILAFLLYKKIGWGSSSAWLLTWLFLNPISIAACMEYAIMFYISTFNKRYLLCKHE